MKIILKRKWGKWSFQVVYFKSGLKELKVYHHNKLQKRIFKMKGVESV